MASTVIDKRPFKPLTRKLLEPFISIEIFPPSTNKGLKALWLKLEAISAFRPLFCSVTCPGGSKHLMVKAPLTSHELASKISKEIGLDCLLHVTGFHHTKSDVVEKIRYCEMNDIKGILALRGDITLPDHSLDVDFSNADKLVAFINMHTLSLTVAVAGYPLGHPDSESMDEDIYFLRKKVSNFRLYSSYQDVSKVKAGADLIITQFFFQSKDYIGFVHACKAKEIDAVIVPGFLLFYNYHQLEHIVSLAKLSIPDHIQEVLEKNKSNEDAIANFCVAHTTSILKELFHICEGRFHFFTLNKSQILTSILNNVSIAEGKVGNLDSLKLNITEATKCRLFCTLEPEDSYPDNLTHFQSVEKLKANYSKIVESLECGNEAKDQLLLLAASDSYILNYQVELQFDRSLLFTFRMHLK